MTAREYKKCPLCDLPLVVDENGKLIHTFDDPCPCQRRASVPAGALCLHDVVYFDDKPFEIIYYSKDGMWVDMKFRGTKRTKHEPVRALIGNPFLIDVPYPHAR